MKKKKVLIFYVRKKNDKHHANPTFILYLAPAETLLFSSSSTHAHVELLYHHQKVNLKKRIIMPLLFDCFPRRIKVNLTKFYNLILSVFLREKARRKSFYSNLNTHCHFTIAIHVLPFYLPSSITFYPSSRQMRRIWRKLQHQV